VGQADQIFVSLNYGEVTAQKFLDKYSNIFWWSTDNKQGDAQKFAMVGKVEDGYYIGWDDDLICLPGTIDYLISGVDRYNGLVSLHGRTYLPPVTDFRRWAGAYRCLNTVSEDVPVNLIGSGCCCFHTDRLDITLSDFHSKNMADVYLSKTASDQGVPMVVLKHNAGQYVQYIPPKGETIWKSTRDYSKHIEVMRTYIK
jgi:hypothetical protein